MRSRFARVLPLLLFALISCGHDEPSTEATHARNADRSVRLTGASAAYVRVEPAASATGHRSHGLIAQISFDERHVASLGAPVPGRVASVDVVTGDEVKAGAVVLRIHAPDIANAQAQVAQARTARTAAERLLARAEILVERGAGTQSEVLQAESALALSRSEERRAVSSLSALGGAAGSSDYALRSPLDGVVVERNVAVGTVVHTDRDQPLMVIANLATVWALADIFERDLACVHEGDAAVVEVEAHPGRSFEGTITRISGTLDSTTRTARARIELRNDDRALRPGMFARVAVTGASPGVAEVPSAAVLARRDEYFVFVQRGDGSYEERKVGLGEQHGMRTTILSGVAPGELVVTEGAILLGAEVNESL